MALGNNAFLTGGRVEVQCVSREQQRSKGDEFDYAIQENLALTGTRVD